MLMKIKDLKKVSAGCGKMQGVAASPTAATARIFSQLPEGSGAAGQSRSEQVRDSRISAAGMFPEGEAWWRSLYDGITWEDVENKGRGNIRAQE
jgi:hypothetical protein